ncbi:MAG: PQ-loop domain-containing transporter [bacterium]|nr:PQ-loop domain-containing transporter [bacterium]
MESAEHNHFIDKLANINAVLSALALYPQVYTTISTDDITGVSAGGFTLIFVNSLIWTLYAAHRKATPLLVASSFNALAAAIITAVIFLK